MAERATRGTDGQDRARLHVLTSRHCNNNCLFCVDDRAMRRSTPVPRPAEQLRLNRQLASALFTCGEPTLNPELPDLMRQARALGFTDLRLVTNARRLAYPGYVRRLVDAGLTGVTVSLHGPDARTHDRLVRTPGAFEQTWRGLINLGRLRERGVRLALATSSVIQKGNLDRIPDLLARLAEVEPDAAVLNVVQPVGEAARHFAATVLPYTEMAEALQAALAGSGPRPAEVKVEGLPWCVAPALAAHWGQREEIVVRLDALDRLLPRHRYQIHGPPCEGCAAAAECGGVFGAYVDHFGWDEFAPLDPAAAGGA